MATEIIRQAISLFDLLPCRTTELKIAGDWLEDQGLHSFMANVVRTGKWSSVRGITIREHKSKRVCFTSFGIKSGYIGGAKSQDVINLRYGSGSELGAGYGSGHGAGGGDGTGNGRGAGFGAGYGGGFGDGRGYGRGYGDGG